MKKIIRFVAVTSAAMVTAWAFLTIWAERTGPEKSWELGNRTAPKKALIVYDPDPFYNLDEQVSRSFGQALADHGLRVHVATVKAALKFNNQPVDLYVFCANTYNWQPDRAVSDFIEKQVVLAGKSVVAITVGGGSTGDSQRSLEKLIVANKGKLLDSRSAWLLKPNDESKLTESNVDVAVSMAYTWGEQNAIKINAPPAN